MAGQQQGVASQGTRSCSGGSSNDCRLAICTNSILVSLTQQWCFTCTEAVQLSLTVSCMVPCSQAHMMKSRELAWAAHAPPVLLDCLYTLSQRAEVHAADRAAAERSPALQHGPLACHALT